MPLLYKLTNPILYYKILLLTTLMKILLLDNYDSFTYNLLHLLQANKSIKVSVHRNDAITIADAAAYDKIVLSPGPGVPINAGILVPLIQHYISTKPILGVCLGHQAIAVAMGGSLYNLPQVYHGLATPCNITNTSTAILQNLPNPFTIGRYHSWVINKKTLPTQLTVTATDDNELIMAIQHTHYPVYGVQFHPESILTPQGSTIINNFINL